MASMPRVERRAGRLNVTLLNDPEIRSAGSSCVFDIDDFSELSGVEVLDLRRQLGTVSVHSSPIDGLPRWSYDPEIDAAYFKVSEARAQQQVDGTLTAYIGASDQLVRPSSSSCV